MILVIATLAGSKIGEVSHELDRSDPFDHLEAQFILASFPQPLKAMRRVATTPAVASAQQPRRTAITAANLVPEWT